MLPLGQQQQEDTSSSNDGDGSSSKGSRRSIPNLYIHGDKDNDDDDDTFITIISPSKPPYKMSIFSSHHRNRR